VVQHVESIEGGVLVCMLRVCDSQGLAAKAGDDGGTVGQSGQSEAFTECCVELGVRESDAAGGWECLEPRGGAEAGHAAKPCLCNLYNSGAAVQASEETVVGRRGLEDGERLWAAAAALVSRAARRRATSLDQRPGPAARWFQVRCVGGHRRAAARSFGWLCDASMDTP
jgi:hypothetical protein